MDGGQSMTPDMYQLPETGYYDEPPRRVSVALYVLGALFLVTALVVLWHPWAR